MKYASARRSDFEYHDAEWSLLCCEAGQLTVEVTHLNIHHGVPANPHATDMEIALARITFRDFRALSFEPGRVWKQNALGQFHPEGPLVVHEGQEAEQRLLHELQTGTTIFEFAADGGEQYHIDGCGDEPWFTAQFAFSSLLIEWDEYCGPAWYIRK